LTVFLSIQLRFREIKIFYYQLQQEVTFQRGLWCDFSLLEESQHS